MRHENTSPQKNEEPAVDSESLAIPQNTADESKPTPPPAVLGAEKKPTEIPLDSQHVVIDLSAHQPASVSQVRVVVVNIPNQPVPQNTPAKTLVGAVACCTLFAAPLAAAGSAAIGAGILDYNAAKAAAASATGMAILSPALLAFALCRLCATTAHPSSNNSSNCTVEMGKKLFGIGLIGLAAVVGANVLGDESLSLGEQALAGTIGAAVLTAAESVLTCCCPRGTNS